MGSKAYKVLFVFVLLAILFLCANNTLSAQEKGPNANADTAKRMAGKTLWIVDVNANDLYKSNFQLALLDQLAQYAPDVKVHHVITAEKGNPFFLLKKEDYPEAAIISLGVCKGTTKLVANYASGARKIKIPSVMIYVDDVRDDQMNWNKTYRITDGAMIEIENIPQSQQEAMPVAKRILPMIMEKLAP